MKHYLHRAGLFRPLLLMLMLLVGSGGARVWAEEVTDVIDNAATSSYLSSTGTTTWGDLFTLTGASGAQYAVKSMGTKNTTNALQWNANGFLYAKKSGGTLKSISVTGVNGKSLKIYAQNEAYSANASGTPLHNLSLTGSAVTYTFEENYTFLCINGAASSTSISSISIVWETGSGGGSTSTLTASDLAVTNAPVALAFDLYNNSSAQTVSFTTSSTGAVTVSGGTGYVTTAVSGKTITVTPTAVTPSAQTITVRQAADETYAAGTATFTVSVDDSTPTPTHNVTFSCNGSLSTPAAVEEGAAITFPANPASVNDKVFVGWTTDPISGTTNTAPAFVTSATMGQADITYYAVYATSEATGSNVETLTQTLEYDTWTYGGATADKGSYRLFGNGGYVESAAFDLSKLSKVIVYGGTYGGATNNGISIGDGTKVWRTGTVSGSSQTGSNVFSEGTALTGTNKLRVSSTSGNASGSGVRMSKVEIYTLESSYSDYCTTVVADNRQEAGLAFTGTTSAYTADLGGEFDEPTLQNTHQLAVTYTSSNEAVATVATDGAVTLVGIGVTTISAAFGGDDNYKPGSASYTITVVDPNAPGTASNPYTVAQARAAIDAGSGTNEVYVRGIVCTGGSSLSSGALNYWISDDGTETNNFEIYRGKGIDGANFTSTSDIQKGDVVVVYGNLTKYNSTYEFSSGSQLISLTSKPEPELSFSAGSATAVLGQPFTGPTLDNPNNLTVTWNSMNTAVATVDATTGEVNLLAAGGTYIRAVFAGNDQYKAKTVSYELTVEDHTPRIVFDGQQNPLSETYTAGDTNIHYVASYLSDEVTLVLCDAEGNPATYDWFSATLNGDSYVAASWQANTDTQNSRTAYFYLQSGNTRSAIFAFTQAVYVVDYATLPFSWDDTTTPFGITMDGVGTYNASPYLRFDDSGDYVILKLGENEVPGTLTFDITGDGFSGGTFSVQTARPGVTYSELKTYTELGGTKTTESIELGENVRYIKWVYTNKVSGNVALGNIHVGKHRTVISVLDGTNKTINVGQGGFGVSLPLVTNSGAPIQLTVDEENTTLSLNDFNLQQEDNSYHLSLSDDFFNKVKGSGVIVLKANAAAYGDYEAANEVTITVTVIGETFSAEDVNLACDATSGQIAYSIENPVRYATLSAECDADWISDIQVADPSATSGTITFTTTPNEGTEPRTATIILKHQYSSYEKVVNVTVTQAGCEIDYETLPFSWEGGDKQDLQALNGVTANGLGSDYAANNNPYLVKLDGTGDYIQVKTDSQPGKVTIGVKMIGGGNTSTITVQKSADGETFTDVEALTISGAQDDKLSLETTNAFAADTRYVRLLFTKGSNVGVGPITITKVTPKGSADNPYTVAEARDMMDITGTEQVLATVQGYVCEVGTINENTHELAYYIADAVDSNERIHIVAGKYLNGADFTEDNILHVGDFVVVQGYYSKYEGAYDCRRDNTLLSVVGPKGSANNPYTVAEARDMMDITGTEQVLATVQGYVCEVGTINENTHELAYYIADAVDSNERIHIVAGKYLNGADFTEDNILHVGDFVVVQGYYSKYNGAYDCRRDNTLVSVIPGYTITLGNVENCEIYVFDNDNQNEALVSNDEDNPVSSASVLSGTTIAISAFANQGYGNLSVTVTDGNGQTVELTEPATEGDMYTFTMPAGDVTITATAVADEASFYTRTTTITSGKHYIIVGKKNEGYYAMGGQTDNNRTAVSVELNGDRITSNSDVEEFVIYGPDADGNYAIYTEAGDGGYLYAASSSSNYLRTKDVKDANGTWTIEFDATDGFASIVANGSNSRNVMQFNSASTLFACYGGSSQSPVYLYEKVNDVLPEEMAFLSEYGYSTLCCKNPLYFAADDEVSAWKVTAVQGENVTFERLIGIVPSGTGILLKGQGYGEVTLTSARDVSNASIADVSGNLLVGVADPMTIQSGQYYGLYYDSFRKLGAGTVPDNRAILPQSISQSGVKAFTFVFNEGGIATGINELDNWTNYNSTIYNLNGQRLVKPQKGFNIINGKKVLVK